MNFKFASSLVLLCSVISTAACAPDPVEESTAAEDNLTLAPSEIAGSYRNAGQSVRPPTFDGLVLLQNGEFFADIDTGILCEQPPCPSQVRIQGRFTATRTVLVLGPVSPTAPETGFHGRYDYTLTSGKLHLTRRFGPAGEWSNDLDNSSSYCAEAVDCEDQLIIHPMCVGRWSCSPQRSCSWSCGLPANPCPTEQIQFTQATGCQNDGSVEFCIPREDASVRASVASIAPSVVCHPGGGQARCNSATQLLCSYPTTSNECTSSHGALTDGAWGKVCKLASLDAVTKIVPTFFE